VRRAGKTIITNVKYEEEKGVPATILKDCLHHQMELDSYETFVKPGIIIRQTPDEICGSRTTGTKVFSFKTNTTLRHFIIDTNKLFAFDCDGRVHIFHFNGTTPEIHTIRKPLGWCIVPNTRIMVTWNELSLCVYDPDTTTNKTLRKHNARVTAAQSATAVVATGDSIGHLCLWFVSSWKCFHDINVGERIDQIILNESTVCVRTATQIKVYNITSGVLDFCVKNQVFKSCQFHPMGILVARDKSVDLYDAEGTELLTFEHKCSKLLQSVGSRCWSLENDHLIELEITRAIVQWKEDCLTWIQQPQFPFYHTWPTSRYMDVFAMSVNEWAPKIKLWDPPRQWFRHHELRNAIWKYAVDNDVSIAHSWSFLSDIRPWIEMCRGKIIELTTNYDFLPHTINLIEHIYRKVDLKHENILKWCWYHHEQVRMRSIIILLAEMDNDSRFISLLDEPNITSHTILCVSIHAILQWLHDGHVDMMIKWLHAYHQQYSPTNTTRKIYNAIVHYIFLHIEEDTCDIPLPHSGTWKQKTRLFPSDIGKFAKTSFLSGFITSVELKENREDVVYWKPITRTRECLLIETPLLWEFHHKRGPHTMFECALFVLDDDIWSGQNKVVPWQWFNSDVGAFMSRGLLISVFDKAMRIEYATWDDTGASIHTSSDTDIREDDNLPIEIEKSEWAYKEDCAYDHAPLKLKICNIIAKNKVHVNLDYCFRILKCCQADTIAIEHSWDMSIPVTAAAHHHNIFLVGFENGNMLEFESLSDFNYPSRSFNNHSTAILSIYIYDEKAISISEYTMSFWCLTTGTCLNFFESKQQYYDIVPYVRATCWVIECGDYMTATIWDIEDTIPLKQLQLPCVQRPFTTHLQHGLSVLVADEKIILWSEEKVEQPIECSVEGLILTVTASEHGIVGATSRQRLFTMNFETHEMSDWSSETNISTIALLSKTNFIVTGDKRGKLSIWNLDSHENDYSMTISHTPIEKIYIQNMFAFVVHPHHIKLVSIVQDRCVLSCNVVFNMMTWSTRWKTRVMQSLESYIRPIVMECLKTRHGLSTTMDLLEQCTEEYSHRPMWCSDDIVEHLLELPLRTSKLVLKRLISFKGPRIDCPICGDANTKDSVSFITTCHHRFHTGCIAEHIRKTPEYHNEMQISYALAVDLKCPTCRVPFKSEQVKIDNILSCT